MRITVELLAQLRDAAGGEARRTLECEPPVSVQAVVLRLAEEHGPAFRALALGADGELAPTLLVAVGGAQVRGPRELREGDELILGTPISGG